MSVMKYRNQIYAGVLGKIIGVYLGRPVEGWSYERIKEEFDDITDYVHREVGVPLIVADDDISGTFTFFRGIEDYGFNPDTTAEEFGKTWLNYIIENKTIFWWGGYGRSTEHTAYLNLKNGIPAPESGSMKTNSKAVAEQIGAQIFIDAVAMACPGNPDLAVKLVRHLAQVSHDGIAVEAACHWAALESMAFEEKRIDVLLDKAAEYVQNAELIDVISDVRRVCVEMNDWHQVREYLGEMYAYEKYPGVCHMVPNHALMIAAIILGGDDFQKSIQICVSAGWDTDCNAGNVGVFNGIRLGVDAVNAGINLRGPIADFMYMVSADGGAVITDAVQQAKNILYAAGRLNGEEIALPSARYSFMFPGSVQGFKQCDYIKANDAEVVIGNLNEKTEDNGLCIGCKGVDQDNPVHVSSLTFVDYRNLDHNYTVVACPTLYSSQCLKACIYTDGNDIIDVRPYVLYFDREDKIQVIYGDAWKVNSNLQMYEWMVPDTKGMVIVKVGFQISSQTEFSGNVIISEIDWKGAPSRFEQKGLLIANPRHPQPYWIKGFTSSADQFFADFRRTHCIVSSKETGLAVTGTKDWEDYRMEAELYINLHDEAGLVMRYNGQRRYYAVVFSDFKTVKIIRVCDEKREVLGTAACSYPEDKLIYVKVSAVGNKMNLEVDGKNLLTVEDETYSAGGAGFLIKKGSMTCNRFEINS